MKYTEYRMFSFCSSLQHDSWFSMTGVPDSMDESSGTIISSVSTPPTLIPETGMHITTLSDVV